MNNRDYYTAILLLCALNNDYQKQIIYTVILIFYRSQKSMPNARKNLDLSNSDYLYTWNGNIFFFYTKTINNIY
jgi:hypothetical protein